MAKKKFRWNDPKASDHLQVGVNRVPRSPRQWLEQACSPIHLYTEREQQVHALALVLQELVNQIDPRKPEITEKTELAAAWALIGKVLSHG